jgi:hypothetical protein
MERCTIFLNVYSMFWNFCLQNYFDMCFDNLIKYITSLFYSACFMISTHLYLYKNVFNDISIHLLKENKRTQAFKIYIFVKLLNQLWIKI